MQNTHHAEEPVSETVPLFSPPTSRPTASQSYYGGALSSPGGGQPQVRTSTSLFASAASLQPTTPSDDAVPVAPWGIHWYTPTSIVFLLFVGVASAIGHHIFYNAFDGKLAGDGKEQGWVIRTGTGLAFLCNASLAAAVGISRKQWVWRTLRKRSVTLGGIDAIFGVSSDPLFFFNLEIFRRAKVSTVMALVMWMIPIVAIFTPGTISVYGERPAPTNCVVPSLKFEYDNKPSVFTSGGINATLGHTNSSGYTGPTSIADYIVRAVLFSGRALPADTWPPNVTTLDKACGTSKCAYEIQFRGPALKCEEKIPWDAAGAPWESIIDKGDPVFDHFSYRAEKSTSSRDSFWIQHLYEGRNHTYLCKNSVARYSVDLTVSNNTFLDPIIRIVDDIYNLPDSIESNLANMTASYALFDALFNVLSGSIRTGKVCRSTDANTNADTDVPKPTSTEIIAELALNASTSSAAAGTGVTTMSSVPTSPAVDTPTTTVTTDTRVTEIFIIASSSSTLPKGTPATVTTGTGATETFDSTSALTKGTPATATTDTRVTEIFYTITSSSSTLAKSTPATVATDTRVTEIYFSTSALTKLSTPVTDTTDTRVRVIYYSTPSLTEVTPTAADTTDPGVTEIYHPTTTIDPGVTEAYYSTTSTHTGDTTVLYYKPTFDSSTATDPGDTTVVYYTTEEPTSDPSTATTDPSATTAYYSKTIGNPSEPTFDPSTATTDPGVTETLYPTSTLAKGTPAAITTDTGVTEAFYLPTLDKRTPTETDKNTDTGTQMPIAMATAKTLDPYVLEAIYYEPPGTKILKRDGEEDNGIKCDNGQVIRNAVRINQTQIYLTSLGGTNTRGEEGAHIPFLGQAIENIFQKSVVSLLSANALCYAANVTTTCQHVEPVNKYRYDVRKLASIYAVSVAAVIITTAVGFFALITNGVASDANFSSVLLTTRNPSLDMLTVGSCLGGNPLRKDIAKLRLRFGETPGMMDVNGIGKRHAAFGVEGEVSQIRNYQDYS